MSAQLATHAEIVKIAHLFQLDADELEYLAKCDPDTLVELRLQLVELFYGDEGSGLKRFAKVGNLLPSSVIATLTREAVGPVLAARIAGFVDPRQAAAVVSKLPVGFVVDIATSIDPRRVAPVVGRLDTRVIDELALELIRREEYVTMGQFVGFAPEETLRSAFNFASDEALLRTAFVAEDKDRISDALAPQTDERIMSIIKTAIKVDIWPEAMDLFTQLSDEQYVRVINIAGKLPPTVLDRMIAMTTESEGWPILIPAVAQMDDPNRAAEALLRSDEEQFRSFAETMLADNAWDDAGDLFEKLKEENRSLLIVRLDRLGLIDEFVAGVPDEILAAALSSASDELILRAAQAAAHKSRFSAILAPQDDERIVSLIKTALKKDLWPEALELFSELSAKQHKRVVNVASRVSPATFDKMIAASTAARCWPALVPVIAAMDDPNRASEALLRAENVDVKAFANAVIANADWNAAGELLGKLSNKNRDELIKRLTRLKLAEGFIQALPMLAA